LAKNENKENVNIISNINNDNKNQLNVNNNLISNVNNKNDEQINDVNDLFSIFNFNSNNCTNNFNKKDNAISTVEQLSEVYKETYHPEEKEITINQKPTSEFNTDFIFPSTQNVETNPKLENDDQSKIKVEEKSNGNNDILLFYPKFEDLDFLKESIPSSTPVVNKSNEKVDHLFK
jgi:hypothetical protein